MVFLLLINLSYPRTNIFLFLFQHETTNEVQIVKYSAPIKSAKPIRSSTSHLKLYYTL